MNKALISISFDYETSANSLFLDKASFLRKKSALFINLFLKNKKDYSSIFGRGYSNRIGTENIIKIFKKYDIHGTWFATGHILITQNRGKNEYRVKHHSSYQAIKKGFIEINEGSWSDHPVFFDDPYSDYHKYPYWYLGDQAHRLRDLGEDIQCHTFSHPYVALEGIENLKIDLEDWQLTAKRNGFEKATIFSFPYLGDCYTRNKITGESGMFRDLTEKNPEVFEILPLSGEHIDILKSAGIELVTRCISQYKDENYLFKGIQRYDKSGMLYIPDINFNMVNFDYEKFKKIIDQAIRLNAIFNIWSHPNNVFKLEEIANFELMVRHLKQEADKGNIMITTLKDILEKYKQTSNQEKN